MNDAFAAAQAALVDSLVAGAAVPAGFDDVRLATVRRALLRKRSGEIARTWPLLAAAHGHDWSAIVAAHLDGVAPKGSLRDGWDVARALRAAGTLPSPAAEERASREAALFVYVGGRTLRLRGLAG